MAHETHVVTQPVPFQGGLDVREGIISFSIPEDATPDERSIVPDIVQYDHKAKQQLGYEKKMWREVHNLLLNTVVLLQQRDIQGARKLLAVAIDTTAYARASGHSRFGVQNRNKGDKLVIVIG